MTGRARCLPGWGSVYVLHLGPDGDGRCVRCAAPVRPGERVGTGEDRCVCAYPLSHPIAHGLEPRR